MEPIKLIRLDQLSSKSIYMGKVKYSQIKNKVTITKRNVSNTSEYQREFDKNRVSQISKFLEDNNQVCPFPTPIILALDVETDIKVFKSRETMNENEMLMKNYLESDEPMSLLFNSQENSDLDEKEVSDFFDLYIPDNIDNIFIVDGQHRFKGIEKFITNNANINDLEMSVTFLINYDIYEQSEVFANINFKQKPVNKSLYYDIFGVLPGRNEFTFTHFLVSAINKSDEFNGLVKMLGKGNGIVSLAFMVETINTYVLNTKGKIYNIFIEYTKLDDIEDMIKVLSLDSNDREYKMNELEEKVQQTNSKLIRETLENLKLSDKERLAKIDELEKQLKKDYSFKKLPSIFIDYLNFYNEEFSEFTPKVNKDGEYKSIDYKFYMFKATGMLGILKIFNDLVEKGFLDIPNYDKAKFYSTLRKEFSLIREKPTFFFNDERFKSSASSTLQTTFYNMLYSAIFEKKYKQYFRDKEKEEYKYDEGKK